MTYFKIDSDFIDINELATVLEMSVNEIDQTISYSSISEDGKAFEKYTMLLKRIRVAGVLLAKGLSARAVMYLLSLYEDGTDRFPQALTSVVAMEFTGTAVNELISQIDGLNQ